MGRLIAVAAAFVTSAALAAEPGTETLDGIRARLDVHPVVRAEFEQTRRIAALTKPVVTRGQVLFSRADGVIWRIEQPYQVTYVLKQDAIVEIAADGNRTQRSRRDAPAAARVARVVRALASVNAAALLNWFDAEASVDGPRWRIALTPKPTQVIPNVKSVQASGAEFVEDIGVDAVNGDTTRLAFRNHRAAALSEEERRLFAGD